MRVLEAIDSALPLFVAVLFLLLAAGGIAALWDWWNSYKAKEPPQ